MQKIDIIICPNNMSKEDKYKNLSEEDKNKRGEYGKNRYHKMSEEKKEN